ncbi:MAG TPA: DUF2520 domain-containing protein [Candidatus Limnocylindrales bacterium]|jgi:predicted short-subunit dehydrogenase-like oxidoreductase (DUF2520 family)
MHAPGIPSDEPDSDGHSHDGLPPGHRHPHGRPGQGEDPTTPPSIGIIGAGRVGLALGRAFAAAGWPVVAVASRDADRRTAFRAALPDARAFSEPAGVLDEASLIFLTVPDDAVRVVAGSLRLYSGQALVHTSGLLPSTVLEPAMAAGTEKASFHPLVAFADTDAALAALPGATIAIEGDQPLIGLLGELAEACGAQPVRLPLEGKAAYHAAAVLAAGGFVALLDAIAELGRGAGLGESSALAIYAPLIRQSLENAERLGIEAALTGPIVRGDLGTLQAHLQAMAELAPGATDLYAAAARREIALARGRGSLPAVTAEEMTRLLDGAT